jgi:hypothetical protein
MKKIKIYVIIIPTFFLLTACTGSAQNKINSSFEYSNHQITIYYEFQGDSSVQYDVSVVLKRTSNSYFNLKPELMSGDIGEGLYANEKRKVVWRLTPQEEESLTGNDYYFEISANEITRGGGIAWYVYVGGILLGGGTAAVLLTNKKSTTPGSNSSFTYPSPPGRPGN